MIGKIFINNLRVKFNVGITEIEQETPQNITFDIICCADLDECIKKDNIDYAVDYRELDNQITLLSKGKKFQLIETLADAVADVCLSNKKILKVEVKLFKRLRSISCDSVAVEIIKSK